MNIIKEYLRPIKLGYYNHKWRKLNKHNHTKLASFFPFDLVEVGKGTYCNLIVRAWNNPKCKLIIGNYCSVSENVYFLLSGEHCYTTFSTYPFMTRFFNEKETNHVTKGDIIIGDDVWIGINCTILSGVNIGQGAIIGAGSVVAKDVPPYSIYAGNKIVKYRFSNDIIDKLLKFDFKTLDKEDIVKYKDVITKNVDNYFFESEFYLNHLKKKD